jgi:RNA polymerase sigma-70 factor (ECF subfamily)
VTEFDLSRQFEGVEPANGTARPLVSDEPGSSDAPASSTTASTDLGNFRALFEGHFAYVWHTLRRLGVAERDLEDLAHDVFLEVYRARERYEAARPLRAWLFGFAFRIAAHDRRRARHRYETLEGPRERADDSPTALDRVLASEALDVAHRALEALEIQRRAVFVMHEVDGFSMPEVAEALAIPLNTAYSRLRLARKEFHERVERLRARQR